MTNIILKEIKKILKNYPIENIVSIKAHNPSVSKYVGKNNHFFIIKTKKVKYFLKRYDIAQKNKILHEINTVSELITKTKIRIPKIIYSNLNIPYAEINNSIYVLYNFIEGKTLLDTKYKQTNLFHIVAHTHKELNRVSEKNLYNFNKEIDYFFERIIHLEKDILKDKRSHAKRDLRYIKFLKNEVSTLKNDFLKLKIPSQIIHGDLLKQNIIIEKSTKQWWLIDWEKSHTSTAGIDLMRSITFTYFDNTKSDMNLHVNKFINSISEYISVNKNLIKKDELKNIALVYYFYLITNIDFLIRLYHNKLKLNPKMAGEDFKICLWLKEHRNEIEGYIINKYKL